MATHHTKIQILSAMVIILLVSAGLRFYGLGALSEILHGDEAYYGLDALSLVENPRLQVYFPANTGREGLWMWLLAPMVASVGATPFALRVTSALVGILTVAAFYRVGREALSAQGGVWVAGALAVLYWHVQLSHIGLRVITLPLVGALAFAAILHAVRLGRGWWLAGLLLGLLLYTYTAAVVYVGYAGLWLLWWAWRHPEQRRAILGAILIAGMCALPLVVSRWMLAESTPSVLRAAAADGGVIWQNMLNWAGAWTLRGDVSSTHNLPNRPVLDVALVGLTIAGFVGAWRVVRQRWLLVWWLGLVAVALIPTVLSVETPHFLRGAGLLLPCALLLGAGGAWLARWRYGMVIAVVLLVGAGLHTGFDFDQWVRIETDDFGITYDYRVNEGLFALDAQVDEDMPIVMPGVPFHPTAAFISAGMGRDITFFEWDNERGCYLSPQVPYAALDLPIVLNNFPNRALPYSETLDTYFVHPEDDYRLHRVTPLESLTSGWDVAPMFGDTVRGQLIVPDSSVFNAGETVTLYLAMRVQGDFVREDYRVLLHLQGDVTPYDGGTLYATGDTTLCALAYDEVARDNDLIWVQPLLLTLPEDLDAGDYHVALGFYTPDTFERLSVSPAENPHDYWRAWDFRVVR